ncbi:threonine aldolase [Aspergillus steynii IBT 23096]|uniref:Threonine aldolase n=1 Tax=Aspergillus steynii IBT 23096 TaxID=1392250 RepID=A0A2I2GKE2_9EURO|nr:threonine aldolase [Aspergillus steynii IBT 23096]PLB53352.1 threonine aldolase [Aspergillus steynii IBT 23096]
MTRHETIIDLFSDTKSLPTPKMRQAMMEAVVGDEQADEDPTILKLCDKVATLLGQDAAVFMPSGTMCNQVAIAVHCRPGDEVVCDRTAHILNAEGGGPAATSGVTTYPIDGEHGVFDRMALRRAIRPESRYTPTSRLVVIEQTSNLGGGTIWPSDTIRGVVEEARNAGLSLHMDGARLLNAQVATGIDAKEYARLFDSVWIDLSKGLGAPVGAVLAGSFDFVQRAWRVKQRLGGAMRQAGFLAAAGIYALDHHVDRLAEDHENAQLLATGLAKIDGISIPLSHVQTNIIFMDVSGTGISSTEFVAGMKSRGVLFGDFGSAGVRAVTYINCTRRDIERVLQIVTDFVKDFQKLS